MTAAIELTGLGVRFGDVQALDDLTTTIPAGSITGLLGRNGAGKSTLLGTVAGFRRPSTGAVLVDGERPFESRRAMSRTCLVRDQNDLDPAMNVDEVFEIARMLRGSWDQAFADRLVERFAIPRATKVGELSQGTRSALAVALGLASRAPLTMFDEPQLGMDPPTRYAFYDELLADYGTHPRTVILSTHLVDESATLFEHVLILDNGRIVAHEPVDDLVGRGAELTGPAEAVDAVTAGRRVVHERHLAATSSTRASNDMSTAALNQPLRGLPWRLPYVSERLRKTSTPACARRLDPVPRAMSVQWWAPRLGGRPCTAGPSPG
jgi:ABC-2 type transport system ATP-binding protein